MVNHVTQLCVTPVSLFNKDYLPPVAYSTTFNGLENVPLYFVLDSTLNHPDGPDSQWFKNHYWYNDQWWVISIPQLFGNTRFQQTKLLPFLQVLLPFLVPLFILLCLSPTPFWNMPDTSSVTFVVSGRDSSGGNSPTTTSATLTISPNNPPTVVLLVVIQ
jgi:hypothetical protein